MNKIYRILCFLKVIFIYKFLFKKISLNAVIVDPIKLTKGDIHIGSGVRIGHHARIELISRYGKKIFNPSIIIGDNVTIEQRLHLTAAGNLIIGSNSTISFDVMIQDTDHVFSKLDVHLQEQEIILSTTKIGNFCFIGAGSKILAGTELGDNCIVGANSVVRGVFPNNSMLIGSPAKIIKRFDTSIGKWIKVNE